MDKSKNNNDELSKLVGKKEARKIRSREEGKKGGLWFGLGMFGLIGWAVAIPTLIFIALGVYLDETHGSNYSWTLMLLFLGIIVGSFNAWYWVKHESKK